MNQAGIADTAQSIVARVAGAALFFGLAIVVPVSYLTTLQYSIPDVTTHLVAYRFGMTCNVFYSLDLLVVLSLLYVILKPANRSVALVAMFLRLMSAVGWAAMTLTLLNTLQLLGGATDFGSATNVSAFSINQLHGLATLQAAYGSDAYYILVLPAWGLASTLFSILWLKSGYIPKLLAIYGIVSSVWGIVCGFGNLAVPHFDQVVNVYLYDLPMVFFDLVLGLWLLVRGLRIRERAA